MEINRFIKDNYEDCINDVRDWVDIQYTTYFKSCFDSVKQIHEHMKSQVRPISDGELEWVLTELPMMLFTVSEDLNRIKLELEVIKLRKKTIKSELDKDAVDLVKDEKLSKSEMKSWVDTELADHDIVIAAYSSLISKVDSQVSFSRELIMGCKKIWDSRRRSENSNPVSEVVPSGGIHKQNYTDRYSEPYIR